jgi:glycosyltransferase involved in cell wall biosynthesis
MAFIVSFPARLFNIRRVHTFHVVTFNDPRQQGIRSKVELFLAKGADLDVITVLDPQLVKDLEAEGFKKVVYVPNGVDTDFWKPAKKKQKNDVFTFIAVGRLEEQKGFTYLVDAAAELKKTNDKFLVNIVGDGSLKASLQNQIDRLKLRKNVKLLGRKKPDEVLKLYQTSDAFILSSLWEGMPLTLLEALAVNMPLITVDLSTTKNIVGEEYIGLVKIGDANSLFKSMHRMISDSRISKMVALQSTEIIKHYEWGSVSGEYINIYTSEITS